MFKQKKEGQTSTVQVMWVSVEHFQVRHGKTGRVYLSKVSPQRALWKAICINKQLREANERLKRIVLFLLLVIAVLLLLRF